MSQELEKIAKRIGILPVFPIASPQIPPPPCLNPLPFPPVLDTARDKLEENELRLDKNVEIQAALNQVFLPTICFFGFCADLFSRCVHP